MSRIQDELHPGEQIVKSQHLDLPPGDLYLTTRRLLFRRMWRIGAQNVEIPLDQIRGLRTGLGYVYVTTDKDYSFLVRSGAADWVTAIQQMQQQLQSPPQEPTYDAGLTQPRPAQYAPQTTRAQYPVRHCPKCGRPADYIPRYQRYHCYHCKEYLS
jgi:hypothetical protein